MSGATPRKRESHGPAGGKAAALGVNYQLAVLMLTYLRGLRTNVEFCLGAEVKEAGKFDDVVYRYRKEVGAKGKRINRLVQLKNKADPENSRITLSALTSKHPKSDFGLIMYFKSFCDIMANFINEDEEIEDITMYTNGWIKLGDKMTVNKDSEDEVTFVMKDAFEESEVVDELFLTKLYSFSKDSEERRKWSKYLMQNSTRNDSELEHDVELFLNKLSFALKQPEEEELIEMVISELRLYANNNVHDAYAQYHTYMHTWLAGKECSYLDREDGLKLIEDLKGKYGVFMFRVDRPVLNFSGREKELDDLKKAFERGRQRVVICGLGGVGKTQLARKFAERHSESYSCVAWLKSESHDDLKKSFESLAFNKLGVKEKRDDGQAKDIETILEEVKGALRNRKSFFIFDNVRYVVDGKSGTSKLDMFLRKLPENADLLMTSRCRDWDSFIIYSLETLSHEDSTLLIRKSLNGHVKVEDDQVISLSIEMQNYPLAIQQAVACIKRNAKRAEKTGEVYSIESYLKRFQENFQTLLEHHVQGHNEDEYFTTTMTTWDTTMEDVRNDEENGALSEKIMSAISYFFADGIPKSDIIQSFSDESEDKIYAAILLLDDYSMVNFVRGQCTVHRLVQKVNRLKLREKGEERSLLDSLLKACVKLDVRNVVSIWEHCAKHEDLIKEHSQMPDAVIKNLLVKEAYSDGYVYGKRFVKVMEAILDPRDLSMINLNFKLAQATAKRGLYNESYEVYKKVWENSCTSLGEKDQFTLRMRNCMAIALSNLGRYKESEDISKEVSENFEKNFGWEDRDSIIARLIHAKFLRKTGKVVESYTIIREVCDTYDVVYGSEHPDFNYARQELALVLGDLKRYEESFDILRDVWEWEKRHRGEEHGRTLTARQNMGHVLYLSGNYAESLEIFWKVYECRCRILGEEHPETLHTKRCIESVVQKS